MAAGQAIRPSQFVLTYGPGSILEAPNGPRVILNFKDWGEIFGSPETSLLLAKFEIMDASVTALLRGGRVFRLPTNADMLVPEETILFRTHRFPKWALCQDHRILYEITDVGISRCPQCPRGKEAQHEAIRFVRACPRGHLDDVDWKEIIHRKNRSCTGSLFDWIEAGSTLRDITLKCRQCGEQATLQGIYNGTWTCSGRHQEDDASSRQKCDEKASVILRNASNLRIPELVSALTIPPRTSSLHRILETPHILPIVASEGSWTKDKLLSKLKTASRFFPEINALTIAEIERMPENEIISAINDVVEPPKLSLTPNEVKEREFKALQNAAVNGAPPQPSLQRQDFEVDKNAVRIIPLSPRMTLRVTPVKRLRVVTAQRGYRRPIRGPTSTVVERFYSDGHYRWYVGVELQGEGIFVDLPQNTELELNSETAERWLTEQKKSQSLMMHPTLVWWHTLSHRLITALSIDSGYSSASIRERVYIQPMENSRKMQGGVLLYTSQHGGDGSLGGLIALVPEFERVFATATRYIDACSNDPLCSEQRIAVGRLNGAACYACLLVSETSCELGNVYLDRNLLRESIL